MSLPIGATPILYGQDAVNFIKRMEEVEAGRHKTTIVPTPKLKQAEELIKSNKAMGKDLEQRSKELTDLFERVRALESALNPPSH